MATTWKWYGLGLKRAINGDIDYDGDTIKCAMLTSTYTPNQDTDETWAGISANEVTGAGYTAGGVTLTTKTATYTGATNILALDCDDPQWDPSTIANARIAVIYDSTSGYLMGYNDFGANKSSDDDNFQIVLDATGFLKITAAA
jgi:hypothetical protein